jgi:hypothetical protein
MQQGKEKRVDSDLPADRVGFAILLETKMERIAVLGVVAIPRRPTYSVRVLEEQVSSILFCSFYSF